MRVSKHSIILLVISILSLKLLFAGGGDPTEHSHHISVFAGYSDDFKGHNGYKLGIEYEYRINNWVGVGGMLDFTGADFEIFAISAGADVYPFKGIPMYLGVALGAKNEKADKWKPFFRSVAGYDFHIGKFSLGPVAMYDIYNARKNIFSVGIGFGISF